MSKSKATTFDPISKATIGLEGIQTTLNEHTKELAKIAQKRIKVDFGSKEQQEHTLSEVKRRVAAMELEAKVLKDVALVFSSYCDDLNEAKGKIQ